ICFRDWSSDVCSSDLRIGQEVERITCTHDSGACESQSYTRRVNRNPPPAPLLGHKRGSARTTRWVKNEVSRVCSHQNAALDYARSEERRVGKECKTTR